MTDSLVQVLLPFSLPGAFTYRVPHGMTVQAGQFVRVPLGRKTIEGVVWGTSTEPVAPEKLKDILSVFPLPPLQAPLRGFMDWVAAYTLAPPGTVLKMAMSASNVFKEPKRAAKEKLQEIIAPSAMQVDFSPTQHKAVEQLCQQVKDHVAHVSVLDGVTGSGKTEVYFAAVEEAFRQGGQALILLPEIILTAQVMRRFKERFGTEPVQWHSGITPARRAHYWKQVAEGKAPLVVGARSALFLPFKNLRLIVVDEEHDASYKQEEGVIYHARDMAVVRGAKEKIPVILASATPSIETLHNIQTGKYEELRLPSRHGGAVMPRIEVVDMRHEQLDAGTWLSHPLRKAIAANMEAGKQSLLFLNRRGYAPLTLCRHCGHRFQCPQCTSWLVEHRHSHKLMCHHCGYNKPVPKACPECNQENMLVACGPGVERIAEEVGQLFPQAKVALMTSDNIASAGAANDVVDEILQGKIDVIVGTQMIAKGHHFPALTLVGVVDADLGLAGGDLRAAERTYQLLHQVSGRAGREAAKGHVILQTYSPENSVMQAIARGDRQAFTQLESQSRATTNMPPYKRLAALIISGTDEKLVQSYAAALARRAPASDEIQLLGPVPAPIYTLRGQFRYRILIRAARQVHIQKWLSQLILAQPTPRNIKIKIDIDPYSFM